MAKDTLQGRLDTIAVVCFVVGLLWWYLGGGWAIHAMMDATRPMLTVVALGLVAAVIAAVLLRHLALKQALGSCAVVGVGLALLLASAVAWTNRYLDGSKGREVEFVVRSINRPSKSPATLQVELEGRPAALPLQDGCTKGASGTVTIHDGALGLPWAGAIACGSRSGR
jgi:hypothetical protein